MIVMMQLVSSVSSSVSRFAASGFARGLLRTLFGELGDKTFFGALVLTAWCPWEGPRDIDFNPQHRIVTFLSTWIALSAHSVLSASIRSSDWASWSDRGNSILETIGGIAFALLSFRAYLGVTRPSLYATPSPPPEAEPLLSAKPDIMYNQDAFVYSMPSRFGGSDADDGGESADAGGDKPRSVGAEGGACTLIIGILAASCCAFVGEAEDKSWYALVDGGRQGTDLVFGAIVGFIPGVWLAVFLGYVMWSQLDAYTVRVVAMLAFAALSMISFSQALLHLDAVDIGLLKDVSTARP